MVNGCLCVCPVIDIQCNIPDISAGKQHAAPFSSFTEHIIQPSFLPNFTTKVRKSLMCKCTSLVSSHGLSLSGCLLPVRVQGRLADFHSSVCFILSNFLYNRRSLPVSSCLDAEVHFVNMTALTRGGLHSSFWIVDRSHIYMGSADMDWRSLSKVRGTNTSNTRLQSKIRGEHK